MKLAAWNCQGLSNSPAVRGLSNFQKSEKVDVLFLLETKLDEKRLSVFKQKLDLGNMVAVDGVGKGGIAVFWRGGIDLVLRSSSRNHIDVEITVDDGRKWRFTGVYGESRAELKYQTWDMLRDLLFEHVNNPLP